MTTRAKVAGAALAAVLAVALGAGLGWATVAIGGDEAEATSSAGSPSVEAAPETLTDMVEACGKVREIQEEAPPGDVAGAAYERDRLSELSTSSSPQIQWMLELYIRGVKLSANDPAPGSDSLEASNAMLDGIERVAKTCTEAMAPGYNY